MRTLVLGLGNPILGDDGVGLQVAAMVRARLPKGSHVEVDVDYWGGLRLMERLVGYDRAIIVDAICVDDHPVGSILQLLPDDMPTQRSASAHDVNLPTALNLAARLGLRVPHDITILAIVAHDVLDFREDLSPAVAAAVPVAVDAILDLLEVGASR